VIEDGPLKVELSSYLPLLTLSMGFGIVEIKSDLIREESPRILSSLP
jgi:hypothetical protein